MSKKKKKIGKPGREQSPLSKSRKAAEDEAVKKAAEDVSSNIEPDAPVKEKVSYETAFNILAGAFGRQNPDVKFTCPPELWDQLYKPSLVLLARGAKILDDIAKEADEQSD